MRPGNGATNVPASTVVTLFMNAAMNASTIAGALHVTENGVLVTGTVQLFSNGQAIEFTPAIPFNPGDLIQVFLGSAAQSSTSVPLNELLGTVHRRWIADDDRSACTGGQPVSERHQCSAEHGHSDGVQPATAGQYGHVQRKLGIGRLYEYATGIALTPTLSLSARAGDQHRADQPSLRDRSIRSTSTTTRT